MHRAVGHPHEDGLDELGPLLIPSFRPVLYDGGRKSPHPPCNPHGKDKALRNDSFWADNDLSRKITDILAAIASSEDDHHFGTSFATAYQLAILLKANCPDAFERFGRPVGGRGSGEHLGFASYLARQMSQRIKSGEITRIEGRFLSYEYGMSR